MAGAGSAIMGIGRASGEARALNAARAAITSPLLEASIEGARGVLLNIAGGPDIGLYEVNEAASIIHDAADVDANIIFGSVIDETLGDDVKVTVIAAGFEEWKDLEIAGLNNGASKDAHRPKFQHKASSAPSPSQTLRPEKKVDQSPTPINVADTDPDDDDDVPSFLR